MFKRSSWIACRIGLLSAALGAACVTHARVVTYPAPSGTAAASGITITADGQSVFAYQAQVNFNRGYSNPTTTEPTPVAYFDFSDTARVEIARTSAVSSAIIRPLSCGITPLVSGNTVSFTVRTPSKLTIEFNGSLHGALHLWADSIEANPPNQGDPGVIYYGPGNHSGDINLGANQTVYIAGGAVVQGGIRGSGVSNTKIRGRGMVTGRIRISNSTDIQINGICIILPNVQGWLNTLTACNRVSIIDYKSIGGGPNSDGIDMVSSQNMTVRDCFLRQWDDAIVIKGMGQGNVRNIEVSNVIIWSDLAQCFETGYETRCDTMRDVYIHDNTVIHALHLPVISMHNGDRATMTNFRYENITVEDGNLHSYDPYLVDLFVGVGSWTQDAERGRINGVQITNLDFLSGSFASNRIAGYDGNHLVENITLRNLRIKGRVILGPNDPSCPFTINGNTRNIRFIAEPGPFDRVVIAPATTAVQPGATRQFTAQACDSAGIPLTTQPASFGWSVSGGGTINSSGLFSAEQTQGGPYTVTARATVDGTSREGTARISVSDQIPGVNFACYEGAWSVLPDFGSLTPVKSGIVPNFDITCSDHTDNFGVIFTGFVQITTAGQYTFSTTSDDGSRLYIGERLVVDNDGLHATQERSGAITLTAGMHPITVTFFEAAGEQVLSVSWEGPGIVKQEIPGSALFLAGGSTVVPRVASRSLAHLPALVARMVKDGLCVSINRAGAHSIIIVSPDGSVVRSLRGSGAKQYAVERGELTAGVHVVKAIVDGHCRSSGVVVH